MENQDWVSLTSNVGPPALRTPKMTWAKLSTLSFTFTLGTEETPVDSTIMFLTDMLLFHFWNTDAITD